MDEIIEIALKCTLIVFIVGINIGAIMLLYIGIRETLDFFKKNS